jgi:flavin reductase (DIM6/NTAB) family NADH-FMN oxidoreductase RutF
MQRQEGIDLLIVIQPVTDKNVLRNAFASFPSGVVAVAARVDGELVGMAASSFTSVSMDPPLVSICVQKSSSTWPRLALSNRIGISVLSDAHHVACQKLSSKEGDRFQDLAITETEVGAVFIDGSSSHFDCSVWSEVSAGDHKIVLLHVKGIDVKPDCLPMVFHASGFRRIYHA